jgi:ATP-binding cassette subfamily F protein uup
MLDRVSTIVVGFDGLGGIERFADYSQWEAWQELQEEEQAEKTRAKLPELIERARLAPGGTPPNAAKKKLSYKEARELDGMEQRIAEAETELHARQAALQDSAIMSDGPRLHSASLQLDEARKMVDQLYERWAELEHKKG